jgi:hypothetical protein
MKLRNAYNKYSPNALHAMFALEKHLKSSTIEEKLLHLINLAAMYAATAYPIYVVIDREGNIVGTQRGAAGEDALRSLLFKAGLGTDPDADSN